MFLITAWVLLIPQATAFIKEKVFKEKHKRFQNVAIYWWAFSLTLLWRISIITYSSSIEESKNIDEEVVKEKVEQVVVAEKQIIEEPVVEEKISPEDEYLTNVIKASSDTLQLWIALYTEWSILWSETKMILARDRFEKSLVHMQEAKSKLTKPDFDNENINLAYQKYVEGLDWFISWVTNAITWIDTNDAWLVYESIEIVENATFKVGEATQYLNLYQESK